MPIMIARPASFALASSDSRPNHVFVDAVRFWSMFAVVALHSLQSFRFFRYSNEFTPLAIQCFFKFGTISFFLISGFLLGERIDKGSARSYLGKRLKNLFIPWSLWFGIIVLYLLGSDTLHRRMDLTSLSAWCHEAWLDVMAGAFGTSFWFVPNLALGMCVLLLFRRHLDSVRLGLFLFAINLIYVVNIYFQWFPASHTTALFAYVSHLWLGSFVARNFARFSQFMERVSIPSLGVCCVLAYVVACGETRLLSFLHSEDATNTLRASNQIFAVLVVLLLFKLKAPSWPRFVNVREQTYGIYLMHYVLLRAYCAVIVRVSARCGLAHPSLVAALLLCLLLFLLSYGSSLVATILLAKVSGLRWTIGLKPERVMTEKMHRPRPERIAASPV
jgi:membrane-bound acyltransferase YfiQ involved in biofilm formation